MAANWTKTDFIGRSEPVLTYNNTTRTGQLTFQIVVDHPKVINGYRGKRTDAIERFFSGCISPTTFLEFLDKNEGASQMTKKEVDKKLNKIATQKASNTEKKQTDPMTVYFARDNSNTFYDGPVLTDGTFSLLNPDTFPPDGIKQAKDLIGDLTSTDNKIIINIQGYAGGSETDPKSLSRQRTALVKDSLLSALGSPKAKVKREKLW